MCPNSAPEGFMGAERKEIPLPVKGTGRAHTVLKNSMCPNSAPEGFMGAEADRNTSAG